MPRSMPRRSTRETRSPDYYRSLHNVKRPVVGSTVIYNGQCRFLAVFPNGVRAVAAILFCVTPLIPIYDYYCMEQVWRAAGNRGLGTKVVRSSVCVLRCVHTWLYTCSKRYT